MDTQYMTDIRSSAKMQPAPLRVKPGNPFPLGATWDGLGVNFALYSQHAERVTLLLFDDAEHAAPAHVLELTERTGPVWHVYVFNLQPGQLYGYRVYGPYDPQNGLRFNANKVLLDPYARAIGRNLTWDDSLFGYEKDHDELDLSFSESDSAAYAPLGAVVEERFEWADDQHPCIPWDRTIIYETHVKGISMQHPEVPSKYRGTYRGLASEPVIKHLKQLGVTTVSLLPVHAKVHDERLVTHGLNNYWGYNTLSFFAPEPEYASAGAITAVREFKMMVRALHAAGLEVIIDVVYNHTAEGNQLGPTLSFRGIDNLSYYKGNPESPRFLMDYTGTGNTLDAGNPYVLQLIMDSLRYWVQEMHVDGFRFDLASALARDPFEVNMLAPFFQAIQQDPILSQAKLIAEPWDVGPGGYQVGGFPWQWTEWNGRYRDAVRRFWRGEPGMVGEFATRVAGSSDLYEFSGRRPFSSINFITAHDGFTLTDFVSYEQKHNEANLEENRDGHNANYSINLGAEGPTHDPDILQQRENLKRSLVASLLLSQGVPMLLGGDEFSRTQWGNNNAYCQDNEVNWYSWKLDPKESQFHEFVGQLIAFRKKHPSFSRLRFLSGKANEEGRKDVRWWHPEGREMNDADWSDAHVNCLGMLLEGDCIRGVDHDGKPVEDDTFLVIFNASPNPVSVKLPGKEMLDGATWLMVIGGGKVDESAPLAIFPFGDEILVSGRNTIVLRADNAQPN